MSEPMTQKIMNRSWVVLGAILVQLCLGAIYAWSVYTSSLRARQPAEVAALYGPSQLGLDETKFKVMSAELKDIKGKQKKVTDELKEIKDREKNGNRVKELETEKVQLGAQLNATVVKFVPAERLEKLSYGFSKAETQAVFSAGLAAFAVFTVIAGRLMPKFGPRRLAVLGGLVLGAGYILAGLVAGKSLIGLIVCLGLIGGAGIGLGYVVPIAVGMKWFPDKKGLITGLAVAGFGFGATLWITLAGKLGPLGGGELIKTIGLPSTFVVYGIAYLVIVLIGSIWMTFPPDGWRPAGWSPPTAAAGAKRPAGTLDFTSAEMLRTPQFYMIFLTFAVGAGAGLMSIGLMQLFPKEALVSNGMSEEAAVATASMAMGVFFALLNGLGRIAWGFVSDKIGRKRSIIIMMATQGVFVILFQWMAGSAATLYVFAMLIGFNFGGNFALFPTITADTFGAKYIGQNYGWVFLSYGVGGILGPILGGMLGDMKIFPLAFTICGVLCLAAAGIIAFVKHPTKRAAQPAA